MKKSLLLSTAVFGLMSAVVFANVESLRGDVEIDANNVAQSIKQTPKNQQRIPIDYVNQPPLIPHSVIGYQVNQSTNQCLQCHDVDVYVKTGATRISPTHFMDRDNKMLTQVAARRYFCLQCHVPQADAAPLVKSTFKPSRKFANEEPQ